MFDNIIDLEEYQRLIELKNKLDNQEIDADKLSFEDIDNINKLYLKEIVGLEKDVKELRQENKKLKMLKGLNQ